jgi:uncharacterized membrane protein YhhN
MAPIKTYKVPQKFTLGFAATVVLYFVLLSNGNASPIVMTGLKVWPIFLLIILAEKIASQDGRLYTSYTLGVLGGLLCSSAGDAFLELEDNDPTLFIAGLGSFLVAHILYVVAFSFQACNFAVGAMLGAYAFACTFFLVLRPGLEDALLIPVAFYAATIATMLWASCRRLGTPQASASSQNLGVAGALVFVVSDAILGYNKFVSPVPKGKFLVMITYYSAQFLIALSVNGHASSGSSKAPITEQTQASSISAKTRAKCE